MTKTLSHILAAALLTVATSVSAGQITETTPNSYSSINTSNMIVSEQNLAFYDEFDNHDSAQLDTTCSWQWDS